MNITNASPIFFILFFVLPLFSVAQPQYVTNDEYYHDVMKEYFEDEGPGGTAIVVKGDNLLYKGSIGFADMEHDIPMTMDHIFRIGSITKQFTAVGILMLIEEGIFELNTPLSAFIEDYPNGDSITVEHLLTHTSGIKSYTELPSFMEEMGLKKTPKEIINVFKDEPVDFLPGEDWHYNNSGYILLGYIIEKMSNKSYERFMIDRIFDPLDMASSYYDSHSKIIPKRAKGYAKEGSYINARFLDMSIPYAAGSLLSTVTDLYKWNKALHEEKLISAELLSKAHSPYFTIDSMDTGYGYGWGMKTIRNAEGVGHGGGINGFLTESIYMPNEDIFVAVFSNCTCNAPELPAAKLLARALGNEFEFELFPMDKETVDLVTGTYTFGSGEKISVSLEDQGMTVTGAGDLMRLFPYDTLKFVHEKTLTFFDFDYNEDSTDIAFVAVRNYSSFIGDAEKISSEIEMTHTPEIEVDQSTLQRFVGLYELFPGFDIDISIEGGQLIAQATGQGKLQLFAESELVYFLKAVEAQIEFIESRDGSIQRLKLVQNGQTMEGRRKE